MQVRFLIFTEITVVTKLLRHFYSSLSTTRVINYNFCIQRQKCPLIMNNNQKSDFAIFLSHFFHDRHFARKWFWFYEFSHHLSQCRRILFANENAVELFACGTQAPRTCIIIQSVQACANTDTDSYNLFIVIADVLQKSKQRSETGLGNNIFEMLCRVMISALSDGWNFNIGLH